MNFKLQGKIFGIVLYFFSWSSSQQGHNVKIPPPKCAHTLRRRFRHYSWQNSKFLEGSYKGSCWFFIIFKTITSNDTNFRPSSSRLLLGPLASRPTQAAQKGKIMSWVTTTNSSNNKQMTLLDVTFSNCDPFF